MRDFTVIRFSPAEPLITSVTSCCGWMSAGSSTSMVSSPLRPSEAAESLGLTGKEEFSITGLEGGEAKEVTVKADDTEFQARVRIDTPKEVDYFKHGGILPFVLRQLMADGE